MYMYFTYVAVRAKDSPGVYAADPDLVLLPIQEDTGGAHFPPSPPNFVRVRSTEYTITTNSTR
jgi:hypothetical protein